MLQLQTYRLRKGLSPSQAAERTGLSHNAITNIEISGETALRSLTFDQLTVLAAVYGIALTDILDWLRAQPSGSFSRPDPEDTAKIEAALADADQPIDREWFAVSFGWTLQRTQAALDAVVERMRGSGQALVQTTTARYRLISRPGVLSHDEQQRLRNQRSHADRNLSLAEANVLRVVLDQAKPALHARHVRGPRRTRRCRRATAGGETAGGRRQPACPRRHRVQPVPSLPATARRRLIELSHICLTDMTHPVSFC